MDFYWELENTETLEQAGKLTEVENGIYLRAYACQQRIEDDFNAGFPEGSIGDSVNVVMDAIDEAYVTKVEIEDDEVTIVLDCSNVIIMEEVR